MSEDVFPEWRGTPIGDLLTYHNLKRTRPAYDRPELLIAMCMDYRKALRVPDNFAFTLRTGGTNLSKIEFEISFAIAVAEIRALAIIAHDDCAMTSVDEQRCALVEGLVREGWERAEAEAHFEANANLSKIADPVEHVCAEAERLRVRYPNTTVAPLFYSVEDRLLYQI